ncbi:hypothetical protein E4U43_006512, partial [Claviceps pusilla]
VTSSPSEVGTTLPDGGKVSATNYMQWLNMLGPLTLHWNGRDAKGAKPEEPERVAPTVYILYREYKHPSMLPHNFGVKSVKEFQDHPRSLKSANESDIVSGHRNPPEHIPPWPVILHSIPSIPRGHTLDSPRILSRTY